MKHDYKLFIHDRTRQPVFARFNKETKQVTHIIHLLPEVRQYVWQQITIKQAIARLPLSRASFRQLVQHS